MKDISSGFDKFLTILSKRLDIQDKKKIYVAYKNFNVIRYLDQYPNKSVHHISRGLKIVTEVASRKVRALRGQKLLFSTKTRRTSYYSNRLTRRRIQVIHHLTICGKCGKRISGTGIKLIINSTLGTIYSFCNKNCRRYWKGANS